MNRDTLSDLKKLCRIRCSTEEEKDLLDSIQRILEYVRNLNEVDTTETKPCNYVLQEMASSSLREDIIGEQLSREQFLANAPDQTGGMIRVPPVMKSL